MPSSHPSPAISALTPSHHTTASAWPVLYSFRRCPYAMRARLAIAVSGQTVQLREIDLKNKHPALLQASAKGTVPVLVLPTSAPAPNAIESPPPVVMEQSLDIMLWALKQNDPHDWLHPTQVSWSHVMAWIDTCDGTFKRALDRCKYPHRYSTAQPPVDTAAERRIACEWLTLLEKQLTQHAYLGGEQACIADMALLPFIRQFASIDPAWWHNQTWPHLQTWLAHWQTSPLFTHIMPKLAVWSDDQPPQLWGPMHPNADEQS